MNVPHDPACPVTRDLSDGDTCIGCSLVARGRAAERDEAMLRDRLAQPDAADITLDAFAAELGVDLARVRADIYQEAFETGYALGMADRPVDDLPGMSAQEFLDSLVVGDEPLDVIPVADDGHDACCPTYMRMSGVDPEWCLPCGVARAARRDTLKQLRGDDE